MSKRSGKQLQVSKAAGALGAFVTGVVVNDAVSVDAHFAAIEEALYAHQVLFFRDQHLGAQELEAFAERFGSLLPHQAYEPAIQESLVHVLESTPDRPSKIELWHSDMTFSANPPSVTLLYAEVVPEFGGDTLWSNAAAAQDALSPAFGAWLATLRATHDFRAGFAESLAEAGGAERLAEVVAAYPPVSHPVIRSHPYSTASAIYVNALFTTRIEGLAPAESAAVLEMLYRHIVADEFTVRLAWQPGTLALWDNRTTQHKPVNDFHPQPRRMLRATVAG